MKAKVKLSARKKPGLNLDGLGKRWVEGESIRKLADEAKLPWNKLQAKLRAAGYFRSHKGVVVPN
jgi:hypothetical protein